MAAILRIVRDELPSSWESGTGTNRARRRTLNLNYETRWIDNCHLVRPADTRVSLVSPVDTARRRIPYSIAEHIVEQSSPDAVQPTRYRERNEQSRTNRLHSSPSNILNILAMFQDTWTTYRILLFAFVHRVSRFRTCRFSRSCCNPSGIRY